MTIWRTGWLALLPMVVAAPAVAKPKAPNWDCSIEIRDERDWWSVDHFAAGWTFWGPDRQIFSFTAFTYHEQISNDLLQYGPLSGKANGHFSVGPQVAYEKGPLWVELRAGGAALDPRLVSAQNGFYGGAIIPTGEVIDVLGDERSLLATFYFADGEILSRFEVPRSAIEAGVGRLPQLHREYRARMAAPEGVCSDRNNDIILVH